MTSTTEATPINRALEDRFEHLPIGQIVPSKTNPRKHFSDAYLGQLTASVLEKGIIEPIIVRPLAKARAGAVYEIVAGECRFKAAQGAPLTTVPAVIRNYSDEQALEVQLIENIHRHDLSPLEAAAGYRALIDANPTKHSAESIATRIGMSPSWVWDRMKLLDLVPEAKQLLEAERISVGHAIPLARLKPEQQLRVIDPEDGGLFEHEDAFIKFDESKKPGKYDGLKAVSVRELEHWISDHIRFDVAHAAKAAPLEFEPAAARVEEAAAKPGRGKKHIAITHEHFTQPDARDESERTFGPSSWKRADGSKKTTRDGARRWVDSPTCEHSVLGVIVAGQGRGETFDVCIARDKCQVHWKREIAAKEKNAQLRAKGQAGAAAKREAAEAHKREREQAVQKQKEQRWQHFSAALKKATLAAASDLPATLPKAAWIKLLAHLRLPGSTTVAKLPKLLFEQEVGRAFGRFMWDGDERKYVDWAKTLGVDVKACEPSKPKAEAVQTAGVKKGAKKKAAA